LGSRPSTCHEGFVQSTREPRCVRGVYRTPTTGEWQATRCEGFSQMPDSAEEAAAQAAALKDEGNVKFKAGDYAAAVELYAKSLEINNQQHLVFSNRSAAYLKLGKADAALQDAEQCVELEPKWAKGYSRHAAALQELKRWDEAVATCKAGLASSSGDGLTKMLSEVQQRRFQDSLMGVWNGTVNEVLGGYDQEMDFLDEHQVRVEVLGRSIIGRYWVDCSHEPHHLNIQVPMQDVPPGMPPPPPVPYIARIDDEGLHLCCPYLKMERPTDFEGPGHCIMKKGALAKSDNSAVDKLSRSEKLLQCAQELLKALPSRKLEDVSQTDSEDAAGEKLMAQVRFESSMFSVQNKFGEDTMKEVLGATKGTSAPPELAGTKELEELIDKLKRCGILEEEPSAAAAAAQAPAKSTAKEEAAKTAGEKSVDSGTAAAAPAAADGSDSNPAKSADGEDSSGDCALAAGLLVGVAAIAAGLLAFQRQRR